ncbi:protein CHLOROPLAST IMPORT APPARATUS 2-like [Impatiens glandulifera]|uniref:protein CHLOROPLAST IMPORT APPARATUS 2-like n=1 Tax=Impatiens glandulifera TaxID=253017 RepID=UPI001FB0ED2C|nr:protein CHLOROPLAST IMPORT APPARATUS 2-like [Impatiens glandulifera]
MSSCLTGGSGRVYGLDLEMLIKSPSSLSSTASTITSHSSSSPTLSESGGGNSPFTISTRKPRTPRKRPNQTYNEAAALLSTAYPKIFPPKQPSKFTKSQSNIESFFLGNSNSGSSSELLIPLRVVVDSPGFLLQPPIISDKSKFIPVEPTSSPVEVDSPENFEWMLDGDEIEEGIDSIMGKNSNNEGVNYNLCNNNVNSGLCYGYPIGWGMEKEYSCNNINNSHELRLVRGALKNTDDNWWRYPTRVNVTEISPKLYQTTTEKMKKKKKKKKKLLESIISDEKPPEVAAAVVQNSIMKEEEKPNVVNCKTNAGGGGGGLLLKLNHEKLLAAWSDGGSPFSDELPPGNEAIGNNLHARLAQIDLFGGEREASVLRYKEKRRTRLFSKKIRYQVRKLNADQRPRMKGRFVRRPDSP